MATQMFAQLFIQDCKTAKAAGQVLSQSPTQRPDQQEPSSRLGPRTRLRALVLLAITVAGLYICYLLTVPFLPALTWAIALAILFAPAHRRVEAKVTNPNLAATISVLAIGLIVVAPAIVLSERLFEEVVRGTITLQDKVASGEWRRAVEGHIGLGKLVQWIDQVDLPAVIGNVAAWLTAMSASLVREWVLQLITAVLTFYLLFYFLRDRKMAVAWLREISPLSEVEISRLFDRLTATVQATLYGTVVVAAVQGALGGLIFWWLGLPAPALWGLVTGLLAIVPVLGAFVVWVPTAIFLALDGNWGKALILVAWGAVVVGGIDNLLYPMLVGRRLRLHTIPAFISIVGGLILFGPSGLLLGPLAVTTTVFFLEIWRIRARGSEPTT
jgi:predicted PurR-regulated permease PerM